MRFTQAIAHIHIRFRKLSLNQNLGSRNETRQTTGSTLQFRESDLPQNGCRANENQLFPPEEERDTGARRIRLNCPLLEIIWCISGIFLLSLANFGYEGLWLGNVDVFRSSNLDVQWFACAQLQGLIDHRGNLD